MTYLEVIKKYQHWNEVAAFASREEALEIIGGDLNLWGVGGNDALKGPPKFNINKKGEINND